MSLLGRVSKLMGNINDVSIGIAAKVGKVTNKILKHAPGVIEGGAGAADKGIHMGKDFIGKIKDGSVKRAVKRGIGKTSTTILSDDSSYNIVGKVGISRKPLFLDDLSRRGKQFVNNGAAVFDTISRDYNIVDGHKVKNPLQLIRKDEESLVGYKATKKGVLLAGAGMAILGTPDAAKQFIEDRKGINPDGQVTTSAPRVPAYAQDGGATGDLVFALNNLRHGGMM